MILSSKTISLVNFKQACNLLQVSRPTLKKLINEGKVKCHRVGHKYLFISNELVSNLKSL
jgi:excisionase family DNA binding protein